MIRSWTETGGSLHMKTKAGFKRMPDLESGGKDAYGGRGEPFTMAYGEKVEKYASPDPNPEEILLAREDFEANGFEEPEEPKRRLILSRNKLHEYLDRLPASERDVVIAYFAGGQNQYQLAARAGMSQPGMRARILRGVQRLRWMSGPGSWFTSGDIERDLAPALESVEVRALSIYWRTTNQADVQRDLGVTAYSRTRIWHLLHNAIAKLSGQYRRGFDALLKHGIMVLAPPPSAAAPFSALDDFLTHRCAFREGERIARVTLFATYDRHARALRRPVSLPKLLEELRRRGVRKAAVWSAARQAVVSGYAGCGLVPQHRAAA